jgi:dihydroxyacetone kinase-like protein
MKGSVNSSDIKAIFAVIRDKMIENRDHLIALDGAMGDGDLGIYMADGFSAVCENIVNNDSLPGRLIAQSGMALNNAAPSTLGTLMATAFMRAGRVFAGEEIALADAPVMLKAGIDGIMERGKAQRGDKTILDVLFPAHEALEAAIAADKDFGTALKDAADAAEAAVEEIKNWKSQRGRAGYYGDASIGKVDAGSVAGALLLRAIAEGFEQLS